MGYLIVGILWCFWLEWYTTQNGMNNWIWRERFFHTFLWPISLSVFIIEIIKNIRN